MEERIKRDKIGRPADFRGFDGKTYNGRIVDVKRGYVIFDYWVGHPSNRECRAHLAPKNHKRLEVY